MGSSGRGLSDAVPRLIPRLFCRDPLAEIVFCSVTFDARELNRRADATGALAHSLLAIGSALLMIESEWPQVRNRAPTSDGTSPVVLYVYVEDVDATTARAEAAGATVLQPPANQFWGDRTAWVMDPSAHVWTIATRVEELTEAERHARLAALQARDRT